MTETKAASSRELNYSRTNKVSGNLKRTPLPRKDVVNADDIISTFEFEGCWSENFGVVLENKDTGSPKRARSALGNIKIAEISLNGAAKQDGRLSVGDRVLEINGHDLSRASLERARWYLGSALRSGKLKIVVQNTAEDKNTALTNGVGNSTEKMPELTKPPANMQKNMVKKIHILKDSRGLGVQISMKLNHITGEKGVFVSDVSPGGAAARDGRLKEGDELLWINGHSLIGVTQQEAVDLLRGSPMLIQLVVSTQGEVPSGRGKLKSRVRSGSQENLHLNSRMNKTDHLTKQRRAVSTDNLFSKSRKTSAKPLATSANNSEDATGMQLWESHSSWKKDHSLELDNVKKQMESQEKTKKKESTLLLNGSALNVTNGHHQLSSTSSASSNGESQLNSEDVVFSDSEPVTLEDKPLAKSTTNASFHEAPPSPVSRSVKKRNIPSPLLNIPKGQATSSKSNLAPGQISPSLPRPQKPGGFGIAFPARYLGDASPKMTTVGVPTPINVVGSNERDTPQAKRKVSNEAMQSKNSSKGMEEDIVTIVLVKGMSGKGLGFTIVGGKGSPHGDMAVYVYNILPGGTADADGRLRRGDELLTVNGLSFEGFTHQQALDAFKAIRRGIVTLKVRRNSPGAPTLSTFTTPRSSPDSSRRSSKDVTAESTNSSNSSSPTMFRKLRQRRNKKEKSIELVLYKEPGVSLGIGLRGSNPLSQQQGSFVQCIIEDSSAAHDGRLRPGDQLLEINDHKLEGLAIEEVYGILDKTPPGKVYIKVLQINASEKLPLQLNDALSKLHSERQVLDKKTTNKSKGAGAVSRLSGSSGDSCENIANLSSSCEPLIPISAEQNKKNKYKKQCPQDLDDSVFTDETDTCNSGYIEDVYTVIKADTGGLGMGVTIDKSRGSTIAVCVSVKTVIEGGAASLATSPRGVGLKLGDQIIEVNGTYLRGMDQEDVIKIFKDLTGTTQMKIRRSRTVPHLTSSTEIPETQKESSPKNPAQEPAPLPKPPENRRRSSSRNKGQSAKQDFQEEKPVKPDIQNNIINSQAKPFKQEVQKGKLEKQEMPDSKTAQQEMKDNDRLQIVNVNGILLSEHPNAKPEGSCKQLYVSLEAKQTGDRIINETKNTSDVPSSAGHKSKTNLNTTNAKSVKLKDELGDNLIVPSGFRKMTVSIKKVANSTLGISLVPSYGKLKGYFQIRRLLSGMVCAQDGQLHIGDRLVSVNGLSLKGITHSMALQLLKKPMEVVTFVILREGFEKGEEMISVSTNSKKYLTSQPSSVPQVNSLFTQSKDSPPVDNSSVSPVSFELKEDKYLHNSVISHNGSATERQEQIKMEHLEELHRPFNTMTSSETDKESTNISNEIEPVSDDGETVLEKPPALPCSPPPPALVDASDPLDEHFSTSPCLPSFSSPPPPLTTDIELSYEDKLQVTSIRIVSPPPELSPRMKELIERDLFNPEDHQEASDVESSHDNVVILKTSSFVTQTDAWDLNMTTNNGMLTPEHANFTEASLSSAHLLQSSSTDQDKQPVMNMNGTLSHMVDVSNDLSSRQLGNKYPCPTPGRGSRGEMFEERHREENMSSSVPPFHVEDNKTGETANVKPVEGRRDENAPFVITYQRKFRGLGVKVGLSEEGKVMVSEVSSFGMVGKDGNIRVGDLLLSISDTPLGGLAIEVVQDMIKNCPRGNVRIVALAGQSSQCEEDEDFPVNNATNLELSPSHLTKDSDEVSFSETKVEQLRQPDTLPNNSFLTTHMELPRELVDQGNPDIGSETFTNLSSSRSASQTHVNKPQQNIVVESSDLEVSDFDDLPPSVPPPPVPLNSRELEGSPSIVDELLIQNNVEDNSLRHPSSFDVFVDNRSDNFAEFSDSEVEGAEVGSTQASLATRLVSQSDNSCSSPNREAVYAASISPRYDQQSVLLREETRPRLPIEPPSLFGDDAEDSSPSKPIQNVLCDDASESTLPSWNGEQLITIKPPSLFNDDTESLPPNPPSLFDDDLENLPRSSHTPSPLEVESQYSDNYDLEAFSSDSSAAGQSPWLKRKSPKQTRKVQQPNIIMSSGSEPRWSSSPSPCTASVVDVVDSRSDEPVELQDVQDDDMASLPPAPPPPRSPVDKSYTWSVKASDTQRYGHHEMPYISSPLPLPTKPERTNSKKRVLPLRIRSKKGRKSSDEADLHGDNHINGLPESRDFDDHAKSVTLPDDDMESLPPAPPPPRMSPLTVQSLENFVDGLQPTKVAEQIPIPSQVEEHSPELSTGQDVSHSSRSPKKKTSFRRHFLQTDAKESFSESSNQSIVSSVPDVNVAMDTSFKQQNQLEDVPVTNSSDAMSPPPLPPEMELWSEVGSAEAELALLDQILNLEDSSRSGNEQSSVGSSSPSIKRASLLESTLGESTREARVAPIVSKPQEAYDDSKPLQNTLEAVTATDFETELQPNGMAVGLLSQRGVAEGSESVAVSNDSHSALASEKQHQGLARGLSKQPSEDHDSVKVVKHRRPAPPIPAGRQTQNKVGSLSRKPFPPGLGVAVLPSRPHIHPKATAPSQPSLPSHQKEQNKTSPSKEKKKLFSKSNKNKHKLPDSSYLDSPGGSFEENPAARERSRSWTRKLFGFRSRSKSRDQASERGNKDRPNDRSRSLSPSRGLFSKSKRSTPPRSTKPLAPPSTKKVPIKNQNKSEYRNELEVGESEHYATVRNASVELNNHPSPSEENSSIEADNKMALDDDSVLQSNDHVADAEARNCNVVSGESYEIEGAANRLTQQRNELYEGEEHTTSFARECEVEEAASVHTGLDVSRPTKPLPVPPVRAFNETSHKNEEENDSVAEKSPKKQTSKPPVLKKPFLLKLGSPSDGQEKKALEELKREFNNYSSDADRLEGTPDTLENVGFDMHDDEVQEPLGNREDPPSPGPPEFKPAPPPLLVLQANANQNKVDDDRKPVCPDSPGPPKFKPVPPPLLKKNLVSNADRNDKAPGTSGSPGPPQFKPEPPPLHLKMDNKDRPSLPDQPHFKPLPPLPVSATINPSLKDDSEVRINVSQVIPVGSDDVPEIQNVGKRRMKPLPPIPTGFVLKDNKDPSKLYLSRQDAQDEGDSKKDNSFNALQHQAELSDVHTDYKEDNPHFQDSEVEEPAIAENSSVLQRASYSDELESSDVSSEWDETCSSTQDSHGLSVPNITVARSVSFSTGDTHNKQEANLDNHETSTPVNLKRPRPPVRRRSSSLPQLFPDSVAFKARSDAIDYWHTGNLQELINSRNQEPDVDEGIIEVQLLKEQQSIGLMVVGGLDTHLGMLYVKDITSNSPAAKCNRLRIGDQLLQVNDHCLVGVTHGEALNILKNTPPLVKLTVARKQNGNNDVLDLEAERRRILDFEGPIVNQARQSSTVSKTSLELSFSPPPERSQRPKSVISMSSFGSPINDDLSPTTSPYGSFDEPEEYVPAYLDPESPTLNLRQDDVPVTVIDGIPGEDSDVTEEEEPKSVSKSVSWAVSDAQSEVFTVELLKNGRVGLGMSVSGGVDTPYNDIMVRQILSSSVTAQNGLIKKGDILLSVNGKTFKGLTNTDALTLLKNTPDRVTLVVCRPVGSKHYKRLAADKEVLSDSEAWPAKEEMTKRKNLANTKNSAPPTLEKIPLDLTKQNGESSTYDRLKKRLFSNGGSKSLKERLHRAPQGTSVSEITLEKGASGLGFSLGGGPDSLYGDAPIHVRYVFKESVAGRSGKLKPGDEILEVNGQRVAYMTSVDALELIRRLPYGPVVMKIRRK